MRDVRDGIFDNCGPIRMKQPDTKMRSTILRTAVLTFALVAAPHASVDFETGQNAWDAGNVDEALSQWQDAANAGDRRAMLELGRLYRQGLVVVQDYVEAHKWFNLAASRGEVAALEERDALATQMTPEKIATAQQKASDWQPGGATQAEETSPAQDTGQPPLQAIRAAQSLLTALGYQPGSADGVWGQGTMTAYRAFLRDMGLPQTDTLTPQALRAMQAAAKQQGIALTGDETTTAEIAQTSAPSAANVPPSVSPDALHNAAQTGDIEILKAALATGVDVNARDSRGRTALMHAVDKGYLLLVPLLLETQADVNVRAPDGATALFMAAAHGHTEIVELLMKAGADVSIRGPQGKTPTEVAMTRYGDANTARENEVSLALLALLEGKTWVEAEETWKQTAHEKKYAGEMVPIPAGTFLMGDVNGDLGQIFDYGYGKAQPVHRVWVPAFRLGKYEVTFAQWDAFVADGGRNGYTPNDEGWGRGSRPVINVSWDDVQSFIDWLNNKTGGDYRLPSEAEWEYAARAGTTTKYSWGNDIGENRANCWPKNFLFSGDCGESYQYTAPVGSFSTNVWGLHDVHGNVWEWVQDCWNNGYQGAPTDGSVWEGGNCGSRVIRGASWGNPAEDLHSATRYWRDRTSRNNYVGFRLAQDE